MKKLLAFVLLLGLAGAGGISAWARIEAEAWHNDLVQGLADEPDVRVHEARYQAGWLRSRSVVAIEVAGLLGEAFRDRLTALGREDLRSRVGFQMEHRIEHGLGPLWRWLQAGREGSPVLARVESLVDLDNEAQSELMAVVGRLPALSATTDVRLSGETESAFAVPAGALEPRPVKDEPVRAAGRFAGLEGQLRRSADGSTLVGSLTGGGLDLRGDERLFSLGSFQVSFELARHGADLWVGTISQDLSRLTVAPLEGEGGFEVAGLSWVQTTHPAGPAALRAELDVRVERITLRGQVLGPGRVELAARNLAPAVVAALRRNATAPGAPGPAPGVALPRLASVLAGSPVLEIGALELATPAGPVAGTAHLAFDEARAALLASPLTAASAVDGAIDLHGPAVLLEELLADRPETLAELTKRGILAREGDRYRARLELRGGSLTANGAPVHTVDGGGEPHAGLLPRRGSARP